MDNWKKRMTCEQAKQLDIVEYLSSLGFNPAKIKNADYWYLSPLRNEKNASFKVNRKRNVWYDHGIGKGGNLVDFGIVYYNCSVADFLEKLNGLSFHLQPLPKISLEKKQTESIIKILSEKNLISLSLLRYIAQRRISEKIAYRYCREVQFELNKQQYTAIGFRNNEGGFELRNSYFKGSSSPKGITSINNGLKEVAVFEGFFNFLSFQSILENQQATRSSFLILNSAAFFEKSKAFMEKHDYIKLYLDRDRTGTKLTQAAIESSKKYSDKSNLYRGYNDLNEWVQQIGKGQKMRLRH